MTFRALRSVVAVAALTASFSLSAQQADEPMRTLFGSDHELDHGGWGAPTAAFTRIMDTDAMLVGARGGWIIDHRLTLGIAGYGLVTDVNSPGYDAYLAAAERPIRRSSIFRTGYGGLLIEPVVAYRSPVHLSFPLIIGAGGCGYEVYAPLPPNFDPFTYHDDVQAFFVVEPGVELEFNLIKLVRLGLGASYRYTTDIDLPGTPADAMRGFNVGATVKIGTF